MMLKRFATSAPSTYMAVSAAVVSMLVPAEAVARHGAKPYYSETYQFDRPVRGYEGFLFPDYYCSYKRYPKRVCGNRNGREICRIEGWALVSSAVPLPTPATSTVPRGWNT